MKPVKNFVFSLLLVFAISANASAGEMPIPPSPAPKATVSDPVEAIPCTNDDDSNCEQYGESIDTSDYLFFEALTALLSLY